MARATPRRHAVNRDKVTDAELLAYLAARRHDQAEQVADVLACMTKRERALVREIAVMANVLAGNWTDRPPPDSAVVTNVIIHCLGLPDLYPTIARLARNAMLRRRRAQAEERTHE